LGLPLRDSFAATQWKTYTGSYFSVQYPTNFKVRQGQKSETVDSAFFTSPDASVEFYIFSPLWNGEPKEIEPSSNEEIISENVEQKGALKVKRITLKAKDGSYSRSIEDRENTQTNNRTVFGYKYKDQKAFTQYRQDYLRFKESWKAWAD
jgi:hypothetical protein